MDNSYTGYVEKSGIYYSEYDATRLVSIRNFPYTAADFNSPSFQRLVDWKQDLYTDNATKPVDTSESGLARWAREQEPLYWRFWDIGESGNFTRKLKTSISFPYYAKHNDYFVTGNVLHRTTIVPFTGGMNESYSVQGNTVHDTMGRGNRKAMPYYQMNDVVRQIQSGYSYMLHNPNVSSGHPMAGIAHTITNSSDLFESYYTYITDSQADASSQPLLWYSGLLVPNLPPSVILQLANLSNPVTGFYDPGITITGALSASAGPNTTSLQQINFYPTCYTKSYSRLLDFDYVRHLNGASVYGTSRCNFQASGDQMNWLYCNRPRIKSNVGNIYIGYGDFDIRSGLNIEFSSTLQSTDINVQDTTTYGDFRNITFNMVPYLYATLSANDDLVSVNARKFIPLSSRSGLLYSNILFAPLINGNNIYITTSGDFISTSGFYFDKTHNNYSGLNRVGFRYPPRVVYNKLSEQYDPSPLPYSNFNPDTQYPYEGTEPSGRFYNLNYGLSWKLYPKDNTNTLTDVNQYFSGHANWLVPYLFPTVNFDESVTNIDNTSICKINNINIPVNTGILRGLPNSSLYLYYYYNANPRFNFQTPRLLSGLVADRWEVSLYCSGNYSNSDNTGGFSIWGKCKQFFVASTSSGPVKHFTTTASFNYIDARNISGWWAPNNGTLIDYTVRFTVYKYRFDWNVNDNTYHNPRLIEQGSNSFSETVNYSSPTIFNIDQSNFPQLAGSWW